MPAVLLAARNCTTRPAGRGLPRAASTPHVFTTRRRCCPTARCWWQGELITAATLLAARNCTTRPAGRGVPLAASTPHALLTRRRCCLTARCWWQGDRYQQRLSYQRGTVRPGQRDVDCHGQPHHRTRSSHGDVAAQRQGAGGRGIRYQRRSQQRGTVRPGQRDVDCHGQPHHRTLFSHGDIAAQRQGAGGRGI